MILINVLLTSNEQPLKKQEYNFVDLFCGAVGNAVPPRLAECLGYALIPYLKTFTSFTMNSLTVNLDFFHIDY